MKVALLESKKGFRIIRIKTKDNPIAQRNLRTIFLALLEMADDLGTKEFYFYRRTLSNYCGLSKETLRKYILLLDEFGLIRIDNHPDNTENMIRLDDWQKDEEIIEDLKYTDKMIKDQEKLNHYLYNEDLFDKTEPI